MQAGQRALREPAGRSLFVERPSKAHSSFGRTLQLSAETFVVGPEIFLQTLFWSRIMPKVVRLSIPALRVSSERSDRQTSLLERGVAPKTGEVISVALLSCLGLLVSLVGILLGLQFN
ncbi:MAG: hypothetical protein ACM3OF_07445 [Gemmatimonas sp.]|jgi:hypothetical protein